jgi:hypothetical protein
MARRIESVFILSSEDSRAMPRITGKLLQRIYSVCGAIKMNGPGQYSAAIITAVS